MKKAIQYCFDNPTISMHEAARMHGIEDAKALQQEYRKAWYRRQVLTSSSVRGKIRQHSKELNNGNT